MGVLNYFNQLIELQEKYATCPKCKSNRIA
ncbi:DUF3797 domain-containing protein [Lysinibacillus sp. NPDC097279]